MPVNHGGGFFGLVMALLFAAGSLGLLIFILATVAKVWTG